MTANTRLLVGFLFHAVLIARTEEVASPQVDILKFKL